MYSRTLQITFLLLIFSFLSNSTVTAQWVKTNFPLNTEIFTFYANSGNLYAGTATGLYTSTDGLSWQLSGLSTSAVTGITTKDTLFFISTFNNGIFRSSDSCKSFSTINTGLNSTLKINALALKGDTLFAGTYYNGIYLSANNGNSWVRCNPDSNIIASWTRQITTVDNRTFFMTNNHGIYSYCNTCGGNGWNTHNTNLPLPLENVYCFSMVKIANSLFLGTGKGIYTSPFSFPISWTLSGLTNFHTHALAIVADSILVAGTDKGFYISMDTGKTWKPENYGTSEYEITSLFTNGNYILAGTKSNGIWIRDIQNLANINPSQQYNRHNISIYPNPFKTTTTITLTMEKTFNVTIAIFDITGILKYNIPAKSIPAGTNTIPITLPDNLNGIILFHITLDNYTTIIKALKLKN